MSGSVEAVGKLQNFEFPRQKVLCFQRSDFSKEGFSTATVRCHHFLMGVSLSRERAEKMKSIKIIIEKHSDGYVAYPLGLKGVVVGEGETYEKALAEVQSAIRFHIDTFGTEVLEEESPVLEAFIAEAGVTS